jgi:hypothetical protein
LKSTMTGGQAMVRRAALGMAVATIGAIGDNLITSNPGLVFELAEATCKL